MIQHEERGEDTEYKHTGTGDVQEAGIKQGQKGNTEKTHLGTKGNGK